MKKSIIALSIAMLLAGGTTYAQTKRLNRTNTRTHDRSDAGHTTDQRDKTRPDRMNHETDVDRNNTNNNTNTSTPNSTGTTNNNNNRSNRTNSSTNGTSTNGSTGTNGSNIHTNNPR